LDCETDFVPEKELRGVIEISGLNEGLDEWELEVESEKIEEKLVDFDGLIDTVAHKELVAVNVFNADKVLEQISLILPVGDKELSLEVFGVWDIIDEELWLNEDVPVLDCVIDLVPDEDTLGVFDTDILLVPEFVNL
jgi:hypothetical protein